MISNYHIDLWEHASKLYHLSHWQQAADIFEFLGKDNEDTIERTKCLVNKALVEARLGDHQKSALTLADAAEVGEDLPITAFIAGLVNCEISQLALAEAWFEACLTGLNDEDIDCRHERLPFTLERQLVQHNLESTGQALRAQELGFHDAAPDDLCYLPAELIFEAPSRSGEPSPQADAFPLHMTMEENVGTELSPIDKDDSSRRPSFVSTVPDSPYSAVSFGRDRDSLASLICDELLASPEKISFENEHATSASAPQRKPNHTLINIHPANALSSPTEPSLSTTSAKELRALERIRQKGAAQHNDQCGPTYPNTKVPYTWHGQQKRNFEPRDARGVSDSTKELARFVQDFAPEGSFAVRRIVNKDPWALLEDDFERTTDAEAAAKEDDKLVGMGAIPDLDWKGYQTAKQLEHRDRTYSLRSSGDDARPSTLVSAALRARGNPLLRSLRSSKESPKPQSLSSKAIKLRWPFQDDPDDEDSPILTPAQNPAAGPVKTVSLDFIMGPNGKTIVIEKAPKTAAAALRELKGAREAPLPSPGNEDVGSTDLTSLPDKGKGKEPALQVLQPSVYEPLNWRKRKPVPSSIGTPTPASPPLPVRPQRPVEEELAFLSPSSPISADTVTYSMSPDLVRSPKSAQSIVSSPVSIVSSVNLLDYLLDKVKPECPGRKVGGN